MDPRPPWATTWLARWKIACASISPRAAVSCRLSRARVARWYALSPEHDHHDQGRDAGDLFGLDGHERSAIREANRADASISCAPPFRPSSDSACCAAS